MKVVNLTGFTVYKKIYIKMDVEEVGGGVGTGWSWLRIGTGGGHL
jgi:hypothetical protein